jgi:hypothetical protein
MFATFASSAGTAVELSTLRFGDRLVRISRASHLHEGKLARLARMTVGHDRIGRTVQTIEPPAAFGSESTLSAARGPGGVHQ